jgi:ArsR family transcriptional regulator
MWRLGHVVNRIVHPASLVTKPWLASIRVFGYTNVIHGGDMRDPAKFFKVLSDEARLKMLWLMFHCEELCVCDVMAALGITQSKASRHLLTLRNAGLLVDRREGLWSYYRLGTVDDALAKQHLALLRGTLAKHPDAAPLLRKLRASLNARKRGAACGPAIKDKVRTLPAKRTMRGGKRP